MKDSDGKLWGKCKWSASDLNAKRIEFSLNADSRLIEGVADLLVKQRPTGEICVDLRCSESIAPDSKRYTTIKLPPQLFDRIELHEDQSLAGYYLADREVPSAHRYS